MRQVDVQRDEQYIYVDMINRMLEGDTMHVELELRVVKE